MTLDKENISAFLNNYNHCNAHQLYRACMCVHVSMHMAYVSQCLHTKFLWQDATNKQQRGWDNF